MKNVSKRRRALRVIVAVLILMVAAPSASIAAIRAVQTKLTSKSTACHIGLYDPQTSAFYLRNSNNSGVADIAFGYGWAGGLTPIAGDWNADGIKTIGLYDPKTSAFYLRNSNNSGVADAAFGFGWAGGLIPIAGDWNGDGIDTIGLYDPKTSAFYLRNSNTAGVADAAFGFGWAGGLKPIAGAWAASTILSISVNPKEWMVAPVQAGGTVTMTPARRINIVNDGNVNESFDLKLINPPAWTAADTPGAERYTLSAIICATSNVLQETYFNAETGNDDVLSVNSKKATSSVLGYAQFPVNGMAVPPNGTRALYMQFKAPVKTSSAVENNIPVIVNCQAS